MVGGKSSQESVMISVTALRDCTRDPFIDPSTMDRVAGEVILNFEASLTTVLDSNAVQSRNIISA